MNNLQQSLTIAQSLAEVVPNAKFCGFKTYKNDKGKVVKHPLSLVGNSVGGNLDDSALVTGHQLESVIIKDSEHWGLYMQRPVEHMDGILWVIDIDYKNAKGEQDPRIKAMIKRACELDILREQSFSRKGAHLFVLAPDDATIPSKINLGDGQEIEIFGHTVGSGKSVLLTGYSLAGEVHSYPDMRMLLNELGIRNDVINPETKAPPRTHQPQAFIPKDEYADAERALSFVHSYDDYDAWLQVGMAIKDKFGGSGFDLWDRWSAQSVKYEKEVMISKWESFKGSGVSFGTVIHHARLAGMSRPSISHAHLAPPVPRLQIVPDEVPSEPRFAFIKTSEFLNQPRVGWRVLDVIPKRGLVVMWGAPGSGKSFAAFDLAAHIAQGKRYQGKRVKKGLALIIAAEGDLTSRTMAYVNENNIQGEELSNLRILKYAVDMRDPYADMPDLMAAITAAIEDSGEELALIVVDTLNRVMHGGNENSSEDMGAVISNAKRIEDVFQCAVMFVHHSGKDETKGSRGHSSLKGAMDAEISILRSDDIRTFKIEKQKEGNDYYDLFNFRLKMVDLGLANKYDEDAELDERLSSCVIEPTLDQPIKKENKTKNSGLLERSLQMSGTGDKEDVRRIYYGFHTGDDDAKRQAFHRDWKRYMVELSTSNDDSPF